MFSGSFLPNQSGSDRFCVFRVPFRIGLSSYQKKRSRGSPGFAWSHTVAADPLREKVSSNAFGLEVTTMEPVQVRAGSSARVMVA